MRNYLSEMLYALTSAYTRKDYDHHRQGKPLETNIGKLFSLFAWGLNLVQEQTDLVKLWDDIEYAKGSVLDRYGTNWGVHRFSENDTLYRLAIRVKVMSQLSGGDTDTVLRAAAELLGVLYTDITFEDVFPAKIALYVDWLLLTQERQELIEPIAWAIKRVIATGVGMRIYVRTYRTYRHNLLVSHGGAIGRFYRDQPVGEDRTVETAIILARHTTLIAGFDSPLIGQDRQETQPVFVANAVMVDRKVIAPPVVDDKTAGITIPISHGGYLSQSLIGSQTDIKRVSRTRQKNMGGAYTRTHIRPKRMD